MHIGVDSRAAFWYEGSGMGTYSGFLLRAGADDPRFRFYTPQGWCDGETALARLAAQAENRIDFWQRVSEPPPTDGLILLHDPHNGFGLPGTGPPAVATIHDVIPLLLPAYCGEPYGENFRARLPAIVRRAAALIAVSAHTKADLVRELAVPPGKIHVVHEFADPIYRPLPEAAVAEALHRRGLTPGYILYLGGFGGRKGVSALIAAYGAIRRELRPARPLVIVGREGKRSAALQAQAAERGVADVIFTGYVPTAELPCLYNGAALFVYPSLYEGFGLPPLEAAACGCPVLTTAVSSLPEVMADGAAYVLPGEVEALADALRTLLADEAERQHLAARALARSREFSPARSFAQTLAVYEKVCRTVLSAEYRT